MYRDENLWLYILYCLQQICAAGMPGSVQSLLGFRYLPIAILLNRQTKTPDIEMFKPLVQTAEVNLLFLIMGFT